MPEVRREDGEPGSEEDDIRSSLVGMRNVDFDRDSDLGYGRTPQPSGTGRSGEISNIWACWHYAGDVEKVIEPA